MDNFNSQPEPAFLRPFSMLGRGVLDLLSELGASAIFTFHALFHVFSWPWQPGKVLREIMVIGATSMPVISLVALFSGMVLGLQGYYTLVKFGSEGLLGAAVALTLIRELGPVLTAIMVVSRAGSAMAAEIGIMRISEQIDALDTMDVDPVRYLVSPKLAASIFSFPLLTALFDIVGILGGYVTAVVLLNLNAGTYFSRIESSVVMQDVTGGFIKSIAFGLLVASICCFQGYFTHTRTGGFGARGVSKSTTAAVVLSSVNILVVDYILTTFLL
jgi:phospholipid/cholesterol/gamma-HCH transport system permease protein